MNYSPDIEWLIRKWDLPESSAAAVTELIALESQGSTACELPGSSLKWGEAARGTSDSSESPLVLFSHREIPYLQSRRLFRAEETVARRMMKLASGLTNQAASAQIADLFPGALAEDRQRQAAEVALAQKLTIITGGPGTGKTYTLARILALMVASGIPANQIRLAAPTGKAADRMKKAVAESLLGFEKIFPNQLEDLARIANTSSTIHSLLGYNPSRSRCRFNEDNPLPCAVLIVDECSMVDVLLWQALFSAMPDGCRLILLGDPHQLESVGQGNVFSELARMATQSMPLLEKCHVHLTEARRFKDRPGILTLAQALEQSNADGAVHLLEQSRQESADQGVVWLESNEGALNCSDFPEEILSALQSVAIAESPTAALERLGRVCILTAQREFFIGSKATSQAIDSHCSALPNSRNQPIIVNHNDPETGLRNGTVGVIHVADDGSRRAYFPSMSGSLQVLALAKLPAFSPAWAITIHRSQGSEYDSVLVILPQENSPMATRELLYTAITRAKRTVYVVGSLNTVRKAVLTPSSRTTLLEAHLRRATVGHCS